MMKNNIEKLRIASNGYRLKDDYQITEDLLNYIKQRITANKNEIEDLIKLKKENENYLKIEEAINKEIEKDIKYKDYRQITINRDKFLSTTLLMPVGVVAVEAYDTIEVIKYFIKAIKTRNAIAISDAEYDEQSVKFLVLEIIKEALKKFDIDENLIMILPYEECFYEYFDKVIYTYNKKGMKLRQNGYRKKENTDKKYIYIEDDGPEQEALQDNQSEEKEILHGTLEEVVEEINNSNGMVVSIYTKSAENAYKFINLVNSQNIFVNAGLENAKKTEESQYELYEYRNIIVPIPDTNEDKKIENNIDKNENEEKKLVVVNRTILEKIKEFLRGIFKK